MKHLSEKEKVKMRGNSTKWADSSACVEGYAAAKHYLQPISLPSTHIYAAILATYSLVVRRLRDTPVADWAYAARMAYHSQRGQPRASDGLSASGRTRVCTVNSKDLAWRWAVAFETVKSALLGGTHRSRTALWPRLSRGRRWRHKPQCIGPSDLTDVSSCVSRTLWKNAPYGSWCSLG